jgi:hypothetical protein
LILAIAANTVADVPLPHYRGEDERPFVRRTNLDLDGDGNINAVIDAAMVMQIYLAGGAEPGQPNPRLIGM